MCTVLGSRSAAAWEALCCYFARLFGALVRLFDVTVRPPSTSAFGSKKSNASASKMASLRTPIAQHFEEQSAVPDERAESMDMQLLRYHLERTSGEGDYHRATGARSHTHSTGSRFAVDQELC